MNMYDLDDAHVEPVLRQTVAMDLNVKKTADMLALLAGAVRIDDVHSLHSASSGASCVRSGGPRSQ